MGHNKDIISVNEAGTLAGLFRERIRRSPDAVAYRHFDSAREQWQDTTWFEMGHEISRWQTALSREEGIETGARIAMMLTNCREWVMYDQAAQALGLVTVPLYVDDRADNVAYILKDSNSEVLLLMSDDQCRELLATEGKLPSVKRIIVLGPVSPEIDDDRVVGVHTWLPASPVETGIAEIDPDSLATIVYTSGTTGRPKGVMLSHKNLLSNAYAGLQCIDVYTSDTFLSFLPLSHTLERTVGYYLTVMAGATVAYARSVPQLAEDLLVIKPQVLISVPRIYERVYNRISEQLAAKSPIARKLFESAVDVGWQRFERSQGRAKWHAKELLWPLLNLLVAKKVRAKLGGNLRIAVSGGAPLAPDITQVFIGLGLNILQGYGLTESSPIISVNRTEDNIPASIGTVLPGVEVKVGKDDELLATGPNIMLGYWNMDEATAQTVRDGWLHTGDKARIDEQGHIYITGRIKDILVLANGEKVPPADMEMAILLDPLMEQAMVLGEGKPYLSALLVLNPEAWEQLCIEQGAVGSPEELLKNPAMKELVKDRIARQLKDFPGYAQIYRISLQLEPWSIDNGLLTPTLKTKRGPIMERFASDIADMYEGH
ncbi:MAG: long-chain fatty acid--CoA ligase [Gammaproteobacteria bacterium]|nr:long-chain fatty acid--CoA ligase [Gammaproteobacteria bacterium]